MNAIFSGINGDWGLGPIPKPQSPIPNPQFLLKKLFKNILMSDKL